MMKNLNIGVVLVLIGVLFSCENEVDKTGYINIGEVYSSFEYSVKLSAKREIIINARQGILDTLELQLNALSNEFKHQIDSSRVELFQKMRQDYFYKEKQFQEDNESLISKDDEQIMKQLNQYIEDYGKENEYTYIFGANGNGSLMFANRNSNLTEEVIVYVNNKYKGL